MTDMDSHSVPLECLVCAEVCDALAVFQCGHFICYVCGLHIHSIAHGACPVCRKADQTVIVTRTLPAGENGEDQFTKESFQSMLANSFFDEFLRCHVHGAALASEMSKMYSFVCPVPKCWYKGRQDPFYELSVLQEHLKVDHGVEYCPVCLEHRSVFLCEQLVYSKVALQMHMNGICPLDTPSFLGHPSCRFCQNTRFYDEDHLLNHMKHVHFTCDICNRSEFRFTYYKDRAKLLLHFEREHQLCDHPACSSLDPMARVFASDLELAFHKQRVHGVRSRLTLFTGDAAPASVSANSSGVAGNLHTTTTPATGFNANVVHVIFDHVSRRETVELMPIRTPTENRGNCSSRRGGAKNITNIAPHDAPGLPKHFRSVGVLCPLMRLEREQSALPNTSLYPRAFGVPEKSGRRFANNFSSSDHKKLQHELDAVLEKELSGAHKLNDFRACTVDFMSGKMLTTTYYNCLRTEFFPSESAFEAVFPLLVATMPVSEKREALVQIEKMQNSPELQRVQRMQEQEVRKRAEDDKWKKEHSLAKNLQEKANKRKGNNKGRNVWLERGSAALFDQQRDGQSSSNLRSGNNDNNNNNRVRINDQSLSGPLVNAYSHGASSPQPQQRTPFAYHNTDFFRDPEDFPALPSTSSRTQRNMSYTRTTQRPNAWCRR